MHILCCYKYIDNEYSVYYIILFSNNYFIIYPSTANRVVRRIMYGQIGHAMVNVAVKHIVCEVFGE